MFLMKVSLSVKAK